MSRLIQNCMTAYMYTELLLFVFSFISLLLRENINFGLIVEILIKTATLLNWVNYSRQNLYGHVRFTYICQ